MEWLEKSRGLKTIDSRLCLRLQLLIIPVSNKINKSNSQRRTKVKMALLRDNSAFANQRNNCYWVWVEF